MTLSDSQCVPCSKGAKPMDETEIRTHLEKVPGWSLIDHCGVRCLSRTFKFKDFRSALEFTNQVGRIAEEQQHHPLLITEWGKVTVNWWTHKIGGLHRNDFIMAGKTSVLFDD